MADSSQQLRLCLGEHCKALLTLSDMPGCQQPMSTCAGQADVSRPVPDDAESRARPAPRPAVRRSLSPTRPPGARLSERLGGWITGAYNAAGGCSSSLMHMAAWVNTLCKLSQPA